ncbi:complex I subunit 5 family protein [Lacrimispora saccharolytica]|uniref:complex I subunit 5 family protein n=1 Tax=Lacrimispora saccharolytica TaxID=84030 RepID=UPI00265CDF95|nr:proton-conducting transporter membrane subunit [Lacrimispora saccharolytica]
MNDFSFGMNISDICGMGLSFKLDGFRLMYVLIATFMWTVSTLFSLEYMKHYQRKGRYYFFLILTYFATVGVFLSADFYTTFIFFEIMSLASFVWVAQDEKPESLRAAATYLGVAIIGGLVMLMGIFLLYDLTGTLNFDELIGLSAQAGLLREIGYPETETRLWAAAVCLFVGFAAKAGAFPLHIWLPKAHPVAPAPASALLSGILTKAGVFGVLILTCYIFMGDTDWGLFILTIGVCTMLLGAVLALFSIDLKRTLACSSVSQIGFILTGIGMAGLLGDENSIALHGSLLHMVNHSLIKLVLFCAAGVVFMNVHSLDLNKVRGFGRHKKMLNLIFLMGALGIGGIPLWDGYISKTLIHESIVEYRHLLAEGLVSGIVSGTQMALVEWIFLVSGGFTVAYMTKLYICIFVERNRDAKLQEEYDNKKKYMNPVTAVCLLVSALVLPLFGMASKYTMDALADISDSFLRTESMEPVNYFSWANLRGGAISILIGIALYLIVVRLLLMKKTDGEWEYVNRWPAWLDLENLIYRPVLLQALPFVFGVISRVFDSFTDWIVVALRLTVYKDSPVRGELKEGNIFTYYAGSLVSRSVRLLSKVRALFKLPQLPERNYVHEYAVEHDTFKESSFIITRSMSFGLMLFCLGLVITVLYVFIKKIIW